MSNLILRIMGKTYSVAELTNYRLSANFNLYELTDSPTATDFHKNNVPDEVGIAKLKELCVNILQPVRDHFKQPVRIHSGYRSAEVNALLNEAPNSRHTMCEAVDFRVKGVHLADVCAYIASSLKFDILQLEFPYNDNTQNGWVHVAYNPYGENRMLNLQTFAARKQLMLSKNFSLYELTHSNTAVARKIYNLPDEAGIERLRQVCEHILQPVRDHFGKPVRVNSGYRSLALNTAIKGAKSSQHMKCEAADYEIDGMSNRELAHWVADNLQFDQIILEFHNNPKDPNSGWVHTSYVAPPRKNRKQQLTIDSRGTRSGIA